MRQVIIFCLLFSIFAPHPLNGQSDNGNDVWASYVRNTWEGYKANYIFCGENCGNNLGLVFDPNRNYEAVSEGIGYAMLMATMLDDQSTFDTVFEAANTHMLNEMTGLLHWKITNGRQITGYGSATDAEIDIAMALIFADRLADGGKWTQPQGDYGDLARLRLSFIYTHMVEDGRILMPGDGWVIETASIVNPSYFAPAWFRIFDDFEGNNRWAPVVQEGYRTLFAIEDGAELGLAPDWSTPDGGAAFEYCDLEGRPRDTCRFDMFYDAIRVPWRIALDCLWFNDVRACEWSTRTIDFLRSQSDENFARMYDLTGETIVDYQNEVMLAMWLTAALATQDTDIQDRLKDGLLAQSPDIQQEQGYWGGTTQYYYNQSLAWFGAALYSGDFCNLYENIQCGRS